MATRIDNTVKIGDVVSINNKNCLVINKYKNIIDEDRVHIVTGVNVHDCTLEVNSYPTNCEFIYKTDTHIQIVEDIVNQIKGAKLL